MTTEQILEIVYRVSWMYRQYEIGIETGEGGLLLLL